MQPREPKIPQAGHDDGRARAAQRFRGGLRKRVQGLLQRDRLGQHCGDPVEAALHAGLPRALLEALGIAQRERGEVGECLEQVGLGMREPPGRVARADAEDAFDLP